MMCESALSYKAVNQPYKIYPLQETGKNMKAKGLLEKYFLFSLENKNCIWFYLKVVVSSAPENKSCFPESRQGFYWQAP